MPENMIRERKQPERRTAARFSIEQDVRYKLFSRTAVETGAGRTVNMSSHGVLFTTEHSMSPGDRLEVSVNWPAQLNENCPLKLVTTGRVVRIVDGMVAISIERYEFRTQGMHGFASGK